LNEVVGGWQDKKSLLQRVVYSLACPDFARKGVIKSLGSRYKLFWYSALISLWMLTFNSYKLLKKLKQPCIL
jgi:hypothetical protein